VAGTRREKKKIVPCSLTKRASFEAGGGGRGGGGRDCGFLVKGKRGASRPLHLMLSKRSGARRKKREKKKGEEAYRGAEKKEKTVPRGGFAAGDVRGGGDEKSSLGVGAEGGMGGGKEDIGVKEKKRGRT